MTLGIATFAPRASKVVVPNIPAWLIAKGLAEPKGAPYGGGDNSKWLKEEERLNRMSLSEMRALIADKIERLKEFEGKWSYPAPEGLDGPPITVEPTPPEQLKAYQEKLDRKNQLARIIHEFEDKRSLLCYKHVD